jgi:hypothetical protein
VADAAEGVPAVLRNSVSRGRPKRLAGGMYGSISAYSASVSGAIDIQEADRK